MIAQSTTGIEKSRLPQISPSILCKIIDITGFELYGLKHDPGEMTNFVREHPEKAELLFEALVQPIEAGQNS
ncbi:MAG: hypothetical protein P1U87_19385 [Verrucomicrobiales bacterium]|nr:hypothetical protein [Verrucomicrobiales bacterium]